MDNRIDWDRYAILRRCEDELRSAVDEECRCWVAIRDHMKNEAACEALIHEMFENADQWSGPQASSHYRSELADRIRVLTGRRPGGR
jgi:hypothetical protein